MDNNPTIPATYEAQLAGRVAELLPDVNTPERMELLAAMDPDDMHASLAFIIGQYPQVFDFALVRDRGLVERLQERLDEAGADQDDLEPYCGRCGATLGVFLGQQDKGYQHFRGKGTAAAPVQVYDASHEAVVFWAPMPPAGAR